MEIQEEDIRRYVNESIRRFVNEELSISNTVALKGNELTMAIMDKIMNDKVNVNSSNPKFNVLTCNFNYPLFDNFVINVIHLNFIGNISIIFLMLAAHHMKIKLLNLNFI